MQLDEMIRNMPEVVYQRLSQAVETGRWPDGTLLTEEQRSHCQQLVMAWQAHHRDNPQHLEIGADGQVVMKSKRELKQQFRSDGDGEQDIGVVSLDT